MTIDYTKYKVLSFDIYGTLIDWETGIHTALLPLVQKVSSNSPHHRSKESAEDSKRFLIDAYHKEDAAGVAANPTLPYSKILAEIYKALAKLLDVTTTDAEAAAFAGKIGNFPAFPDTVAAMHVLGKHYKLIALSNTDRALFSKTLSGPLADVKFDGVYIAEDIGSYKPDLKNFEYLIKHAEQDFGAKKEEILHVAVGVTYDHVPAKQIGLQPGVWISREYDDSALDGEPIKLGAQFVTLGELAAVVEKAFDEQK